MEHPPIKPGPGSNTFFKKRLRFEFEFELLEVVPKPETEGNSKEARKAKITGVYMRIIAHFYVR